VPEGMRGGPVVGEADVGDLDQGGHGGECTAPMEVRGVRTGDAASKLAG
jgi:hypothetical protein